MKKIISILLILCMLFISTYAYSAERDENWESQNFFSDTKDHWAAYDIYWVRLNELMIGYPDGTFLPDNNITRAEALKTVALLYGIESEAKEFADVKESDWFYPFIQIGHNAMPPFTDDNFYPNEDITRQDAIYAIVKARFGEVTADESTLGYFKDSYKIADYAKSYIAFAKEHGMAAGYEDNTIRPDSSITRAEFAKLLKFSTEIVIEEPVEPAPPVQEDEEKVSVSNFIPVSSVSLTKDDNGNEVKQINGIKTVKDVSFLTTESFDMSLKKGDTVIPVFNSKNLVKNCRVLATLDGNTVVFGSEYMTDINKSSNKSKYYFGEIENIDRFIVTLKDDASSVGSNELEFVAKGDVETYIYYTGANERNNLYVGDLDELEFENGEIYLGSDLITKAYVVAREIDGIMSEMTIYAIK